MKIVYSQDGQNIQVADFRDDATEEEIDRLVGGCNWFASDSETDAEAIYDAAANNFQPRSRQQLDEFCQRLSGFS